MTRRTEWLPGILGLFFVIFFLMLSYYNRLASDDYFSIYTQEEYGIWGAMLYSYEHWVGHWAAKLVQITVINISYSIGSLLPAHMIMLVIAEVFRNRTEDKRAVSLRCSYDNVVLFQLFQHR